MHAGAHQPDLRAAAACSQLVLDRRLGEYVLPDGWQVLAAGNRETDRAVTSRMPSALANRFVHLNFEADLDDWVSWALNWAGITTEVISFLRFRPGLLHAFDPKLGEKAFPSPRSWEFVSRLLAASQAPETEYELLRGTVGEGAAPELLAFLRIYRSLPNPDAVLTTPEQAVVPDDPATLYAICGALAAKAGEQNFDRRLLARRPSRPRSFVGRRYRAVSDTRLPGCGYHIRF